MRLGLADMLVFLEVVEARSFSAAAERLGRTRSAISQAVSRLEEDVGSRLLYRSTRSLTLTEPGTRLLTRCHDIRQSYDGAVADMMSLSHDPSGHLTVTAPHALCASFLVSAVGRFLAEFPEMSVRLIAEDARIDLIEAQIDLAIRVGTPDGQTAKVSKLGQLGESLFASPDYIAQQGGVPQDIRDLCQWRHIANDWQGTPITYTTTDGAQFKVEPRLRCNSFPNILTLTEASLGVARLPDSAADPSIRSGRLVALADLGSTPIHSMHQFDKNPPPKVRRFLETLRVQLRLGTRQPAT